MPKTAEGAFLHRAPGDEQALERSCFYFLLQMEGRDPYIVAPAIAKQKKEEDTIRPVLIVRYVTMAGEEGFGRSSSTHRTESPITGTRAR